MKQLAEGHQNLPFFSVQNFLFPQLEIVSSNKIRTAAQQGVKAISLATVIFQLWCKNYYNLFNRLCSFEREKYIYSILHLKF